MLNLKMPVVESERLRLRPIRLDDAPAMFAYASDPEVLKYLWWEPHTQLSQSEEAIRDRFLTRPSLGVPEAYAIVWKANDQMIGTIDVHTVHFGDVGVLGYVIHKDYWGKGVMSEALKLIVPVLFHHCGFYRVEINHSADNIASGKVIEHAGFVLEGRFRQRKVERDGHRSDYLYYGLLKDDDIVTTHYTKEHYEKTLSQ